MNKRNWLLLLILLGVASFFLVRPRTSPEREQEEKSESWVFGNTTDFGLTMGSVRLLKEEERKNMAPFLEGLTFRRAVEEGKGEDITVDKAFLEREALLEIQFTLQGKGERFLLLPYERVFSPHLLSATNRGLIREDKKELQMMQEIGITGQKEKSFTLILPLLRKDAKDLSLGMVLMKKGQETFMPVYQLPPEAFHE